MIKKIEFSPDGKCPICRKWFKSESCPHNIGQVLSAVTIANAMADATKILAKNG